MTTNEIKKIYEDFHTPLHVQRHCQAVADFALMLAEKLQRKGIKVSIPLLKDAALLHDIVRYVDFKELNTDTWGYPVSQSDLAFWVAMRKKHAGQHHADVGALYLAERGLTDIAAIVLKHNFLRIKVGFSCWEEKILYYADKRAKHDTIVSLSERLHDGKQRNAPHLINDPASEELDQKVFALEQEIFDALGETV